MNLLFRQDAADRLGVHFSRLDYWRQKGLIPEAVQVGRYHLIPADKLEVIRARLAEAGVMPRPTPQASTVSPQVVA